MANDLPMDDASSLGRYGIEPDPVIEAYKKDVDRTLWRENLPRTVEERFENMMRLQELAAETATRGSGSRSAPVMTD